MNGMTHLGESGFDFPKREAFAGASTTAKQRNEIPRGQNMLHRLLLFIIQFMKGSGHADMQIRIDQEF
jgi:hypothetical protein